MVLASFKTEENMFNMPPKFLFRPTLMNYTFMFHEGILKYVKNSAVAAFASTFIAMVLGSLGGYALARGRMRMKNQIAFWIITTRMAPIAAIILPLYIIFRSLHILNTIKALIVAHTTFNLPFAIWLMMGFFREIPREVEEAALVDGCSPFQAFYRVALPLVTPGLLVTAILSIMFSWNDYAFAVLYTAADSQTLPVVAARLMTMRGILWGQVMSMGTLIFVPILAAALLIRKYLVRGLTMGAIK
ncbi:MAG: carbohydrate ABC transporter permease [Firmicutes bacterium]|nr:carbohydrate ABC transporter permease [Bacillota bacterium]